MLAVVAAGADVGGGAGALGSVRGGVGGRRPARQGRFDRGGAQRGPAHVDQCDLVALHGHADDGPVDSALGELLEGPAPGGGLGHPDLGEQFPRLEHGLEQALEELADTDLAGAVGAPGDHGGIQGEQHGGQVGGRVGVDERAAEGAAVAHLRVAHLAGGVRQQRQLGRQQAGARHLVMTGQGANGDMAARIADVVQLGQPADVDQDLGDREPQLHQGQQ